MREELSQRFFKFAVSVISLSRRMSADRLVIDVLRQLMRSATSIGANWEEAVAGLSKSDFTHSANIARKEAREAYYWLRIVAECFPSSQKEGIDRLIKECNEIISILTTVVKKQQTGLMKKIITILLFSSLIPHPSSLLYAEGGRVGELFDHGAGARPIAMGGAFTAVSRDASAVYYNPSGLGMLARPNLQLMHSTLFEGAYYDFMGYAGHFNALPGGWGLEFIRLTAGGAEGRDAYNNRTSDFDYSETALAAAAGLKGLYFPKLSAGAAFKYLNRALAGSGDNHFALDLGLQYGPLLRGRLDLGLVADNIVSFASGDTSDKMPLLLKAGAGFRVTGDILIAAEIDGEGKFRIGSEYAMAIGSVRAGLDDANMVSLGLGTVFMKAYSLDLAVSRHPVLGLSNKISLGYQFGAGKTGREDKPAVRGRDYLEKAKKALNERRYTAFLENLDNALAMDHSLSEGKWGERCRRMSLVVEKLNLKYNAEKESVFSANTEQALMAQAAMTAYMDAQELKSMLFVHAAAGANLKEAAFEEFLNLLSGLTKLPVRQDEVLPKLTLINEKMRKADLNFQLMKFDLAAKECEEVLLLDETNLLTRIRLGSAYFAIGDEKRAREAYEAALQQDPNNAEVLEFMKLKGWERGK